MSALPDDVDGRLDELYCAPLEDFVARRRELAKELRAEGRRSEAAVVAKLPKPSVAAWAVNQVVRSQPAAARALWEAGDAVLSGRDLRSAIAAQRTALAPLADAARGLLTSRGAFLGEQAVQQVVETLHAAAVDRDAREDVARGRLAKPLRLSGLGALPALADRESPGTVPAPDPGTVPAPAEEAQEPPQTATSEPAGSVPAEAAGPVPSPRARRRLDRAERALEKARERVEARRAELLAAEAELAEREDEAREAREALED